ncbi:MAG: response regulator, partial [Desulfamplus sp.]|nr:response regulator [Desulfamplus sp.]
IEMSLARKVIDPNGGSLPVGVLVAHVNIEEILLFTSNAQRGLGKSGEIMLVDHNQMVLTPLKYPLADGSTRAQSGKYKLGTLPAVLASKGKEGIIYAEDYRGVPVLACFRHIQVDGDIGWGMIIKQDKSEIMAFVWRQIGVSSIAGLAGILIALGCCALFARHLAHPLQKLTLVATQLGKGDFTRQIDTENSYREVLDLALAFSHMSGRLRDWEDELSREINAKTCQLAGELASRKETEVRLKESEQTLSTIFNAANDGILVADAQTHRLVRGNRAICRMLGYSEAEIKELSVRDIHPPEALPQVMDAFEKQLRKELVVARNLPVKCRDGSVFYADISSSPLTLYDRPHLLGIFRDITEQLRAAEERFHLEDQLRQSQKIESIGRLAGGVAHDFNNMLSVILGYGENILQELDIKDPLREQVGAIVNAGKRSADLTRQLLAFSRKQTLQPKVLNINVVILDLERLLRRLIGENIELEKRLADNLSFVKADPGQIEQVIMNLVVNSRDAMPDGGSLVIETENIFLDDAFAKLHPGVKPGKHVLLSVTDTGCGMDNDTLSKIFEPFFTTKEQEKGTGLGLATVYGIVRQSEGTIWPYSEIGRGTTFKIYLPKTQAETSQQENEKKTQNQGAAGGEHILVVEDEDALRELCEVLLSAKGYKVTLAADGNQALQLVKEQNIEPDLVITDLIMPGMNGMMLVENILKLQPDVKVLYMSGYTDETIGQYGVLADDICFIQKPFSSEALNAMVRKAIMLS